MEAGTPRDGSLARDAGERTDGGPSPLDGGGAPNDAGADAGQPPVHDGSWTRRGGSLSVDLHGWTNNPAIASDGGTVYAAWVQHLNPAERELSGIRVAQLEGGAWTHLGGRIGHTTDEAHWPEAYDPSLAALDGVPYVAWYEGGGYGWDSRHGSSVFVAHWDGGAWVQDRSDNDIGSLNASVAASARSPRLVVVSGSLFVSWIEYDPDLRIEQLLVARLTESGWDRAGALALDAGYRVVDVAIAGVGSDLYVAWTELDREASELGSGAHVARLDRGSLVRLGGALNIAADGRTNYLDITESGGVAYVAWQEKTLGGPYQIYVRHWDGSAWRRDGESLNSDRTALAGRPAIEGDARGVWLGWTEGLPQQRSQLRARRYDGTSWSAASGSLNRSSAEGAADSPELTIVDGVPFVVWVERDEPSATKQVYVAAADAGGDERTDTLTRYGSDGPSHDFPPNTWVVLEAGGITDGAAGVGDEGYSSIHYVRAIDRSVVFGKYHAVGDTSEEDQNALLAYDATRNRWDVVEITEAAWSEHLPGVGHDEGHVTVDPERGLYLTQGNLTLHGGTRYSTYVYDLVARRGQRMLPLGRGPRNTVSSGAFDPRRGWAYIAPYRFDVAANRWDMLRGCAEGGWSKGAAYDPVHDLLIEFGGHGFSEPDGDMTTVVEMESLRCTDVPQDPRPPGGYAHLTFNSRYGVIMALTGGEGAPMELWAFDGERRTWTRVGSVPAGFPANGSGQKLTYDEAHDLLLFHGGTDLRALRAYRYVP